MTPVVLLAAAQNDVDETVGYYLSLAAFRAADGFVDALDAALVHISRHPATGSPRFAYELNLPGLRTWPLSRYPYLVFYMENDGRVQVWRVLHGTRDIPAWIAQPSEP